MKTKSRGVLLIVFTTPVIGLFLLLKRLPVYPDEEQWIYVNARQFTDHTMQYLFPVCREGFQIAQPVVWYPIRFVEWFLYSHLGFVQHIRAVGIIQALITLLLLNQFLNLYARERRQAQGILFSGIMIGLFPFLIVLNRPEQLLLILFVSSLNLTHAYKFGLTLWKKLLLIILIGLLFLSMPAIHPKGSLFALMACAIFIFVVKGNARFAKIGLFVSTCLSIAVSTQVWSIRTFCPESEFLTRTFGDITLNPTQIDFSTIKKIIGNIARTPKYLLNMMYQGAYQSDWMAQRDQVPVTLLILANIGLILFTLFLLYSLYKSARDQSFQMRNLDDSMFIAITFICGFAILAVLQRTKNFYDSYLPAILILLATAITIDSKKLKWNLRAIFAIPAIISIPALFMTAGNFPDDNHFTNEMLTKRIIKECGISRIQLNAGNFVIGSPLSRTFWDSPRFIYADYLWGWWAQGVDAEKFIRDSKPPVIILRNEGLLTTKKGDVVIGDYICRNSKNSAS